VAGGETALGEELSGSSGGSEDGDVHVQDPLEATVLV